MDIASKLSKYLVSPLTKSDIEYVILAGSSFSPLSSAKISIFAGHGGRLGARSARFFKDLGFGAPEISKFFLARRGLRI